MYVNKKTNKGKTIKELQVCPQKFFIFQEIDDIYNDQELYSLLKINLVKKKWKKLRKSQEEPLENDRKY